MHLGSKNRSFSFCFLSDIHKAKAAVRDKKRYAETA